MFFYQNEKYYLMIPSSKILQKLKYCLLLSALSLVVSILLFQCRMDTIITEPIDYNSPQPKSYGILLGRIKNESGIPIPNVVIRIQNKSSISNDQGWFSVTDLNAGAKIQVSFTKSNYVSIYKLVDINIGQSSFLDAVIPSANANLQMVKGSTGGQVTFNDAAVASFGPLSFVDEFNKAYINNVYVAGKYFDPTSSIYNQIFHGNFNGVTQNGSTVILQSYGFIDIALKSDAGAKIKIADGFTSNLSIPIPAILRNSAPDNLPLWFYDSTASVWKEEGSALRAGNYYRCTVSHLSSWSVGTNFSGTTITGRVVGGDGNPIYNVLITADGQDYINQTFTYTSVNGTFSIGAKANSSIKIKAAKDGYVSSTYNITTLSAGENKDLGDIVLVSPIASITLTWGQQPKDLDAHLITPSINSQNPSHIYWGSKGSIFTYPFAFLDTDDSNGNGPEVITISKLLTGVYKFYIQNYSGENSFPIANSNAKVTLVINGQLYSFSIPDANINRFNTWRVFEISVLSNGAVSINSLNDFKPSSDIIPNYLMHK